MLAALAISLPVFAVIGVGFLAGQMRFAQSTDAQALNNFVFKFAMPAALFGLMAASSSPGGVQLKVAISFVIAGSITIFFAYFIGKKFLGLTPQEAGAHGFVSTLGNAVFLGFPIAISVPGWADTFAMLMLVEGIVIFGIASSLMGARTKTGLGAQILDALTRPLKNPLIAAMIAGIMFAVVSAQTGLTLAEPVSRFTSLLGRAGGPTALFSFGLFLATNTFPDPRAMSGKLFAVAIVKLVFLPALMFALLALFGINDPLLLGPAALFTLVPSGIGAYIMTSHYGHYQRECAAAIAVTTVLSLITISAVLAIYAVN